MSFVGEAALSGLFDILFQQIASSSQSLKFVNEKSVHSEITKWGKLLTQMKAVLEDAEEKQLTNSSVKMWLDDLKDLAYDVEDILDEFATESLQTQLKQKAGASTNKVRRVLHSVTTAINPVAAAKFNTTIMSKMNEITNRFQDISDRKSSLNLIENIGTSSSSKKVWQRPPTTCLQYEPQVYGRDEDKKKLLNFLLKNETSELNVGVIPIVGMGGVGKTTLAQLVYNDVEVKCFDLKAWVCVSDEFDIMRITKGILEAVTLQSCDLKELNQVQLKLSEALSGKKFLIVLDDVWNKKYGDWDVLRSPFMVGAPGSKVIVTTRSIEVGVMMGTVKHQNLECVSDEDCWSIFARHAFENRSVEAHPNLKIIGRKIVKRCDGLPLAAKSIGGMLRSKQRENEWEDILNSKIWSLKDDDDIDILPALRLSYYHLPSHLKRCFAYCAIFPKDFEFEENELVFLWMAEGLIQQQHDSKQMEELGGEYFEDLFSRSFFQASNKNDNKRFIMHDLMNDLAQKVVGETCFRLEENSMVDKQFKKEKARHASYIISYCDRIERFKPFCTMKCVRTFLPLSLKMYDRWFMVNYIGKNVVYDLLLKLRCLRVLSFRNYQIVVLPDSIGDLKHLRYLDLSYTRIESLPEKTTSLVNLQTMLLRGCFYLKKLPKDMQKLINLRHLDILGINFGEGMPILGIEELKNVRTLPIFVVGKGSEAGITALMNLKYLQGALCISRLENVVNISDISRTILMDKKGIDDLVLRWKYNNTPEQSLDRGVLDKMKPHVNIKKLTITGYAGSEFPPWVGDSLFHNMMQLKLENCKKCTTLPHLGLLSSLKNLIIKGFPNVKTIDSEFYGGTMNNLNPFPALETLQFENMDEWKNWNICGFEFHNLHELSVVRCPKLLGKLPSDMRSLEKLEIEECQQLVVSFQNLPVISDLRIRGCKKVELSRGCNSPNYMRVSSVSFLFPPKEFMQGMRKVKTLSVGWFCKNALPALTWNFQERLPDTMVENEELLQNCIYGSEIEVLEIGSTWEILEKLFVRDSQKLISDFPSTLRIIKFHCCNAIIYRSLFVKELEIHGCQSLISIRRHQLPPTLKRLKIYDCRKLQSLLNDGMYSSSSRDKNSDLLTLEYLDIYDCESLTSLGKLPVSLKHLEITQSKLESIAEILDNNIFLEYFRIRDLPNLKFLPKSFHKLKNLHDVRIYSCPSLVSFPQEGLPNAHLKKLKVQNCEKLKALPDNMQNLTTLEELAIGKCEKLVALFDNMLNLSSLQKLHIRRCPGIMSYPEEGFPTNLTLLILVEVKFCTPLFEWGLHKLNSLKSLSIIGGCSEVVSFPQDEIEMKLPTSLTELHIERFPNLKYLSNKGFEGLILLGYLGIVECPKLASFPKNGLPPSLLKLYIRSCPLLEQRCQKAKGRESLEIARVPEVDIVTWDTEDNGEEK